MNRLGSGTLTHAGSGCFCLSTWEWQADAQIRGFAHPAVFALLYKLLELTVSRVAAVDLVEGTDRMWQMAQHLDSRWAIAYGPRLLQVG